MIAQANKEINAAIRACNDAWAAYGAASDSGNGTDQAWMKYNRLRAEVRKAKASLELLIEKEKNNGDRPRSV